MDYVYVELLKYNYGYNQDAALINPATVKPTAEREKWVVTLKWYCALIEGNWEAGLSPKSVQKVLDQFAAVFAEKSGRKE